MTAPHLALVYSVIPEPDQQFVLFWYRYPRKVCKADAQRAWARLSPADRQACLELLPAHVAHWQLSGTLRRFIPHAATFINQRRWEDEIEDLDSPLTSLGRCDWNRNGTREAGRGQCEADAVATAPVGHANAGHLYCAAHARAIGIKTAR
jgi:hypothetical protein